MYFVICTSNASDQLCLSLNIQSIRFYHLEKNWKKVCQLPLTRWLLRLEREEYATVLVLPILTKTKLNEYRS